MAVEEALYNLLSADDAVAALVGIRISPLNKLENTVLPAITYRRIASTRFPAMGIDSPVVKGRFQIDCWAMNYADSIALKEAVRHVVQRWRTDPDAMGTKVMDTFLISEIDFFEDDTLQYHIAMDIEINYYE